MLNNPRLRRLQPRRLLLLAIHQLNLLLKASSAKVLPVHVQQILAILVKAAPLLVASLKLIPARKLLSILKKIIKLLARNSRHIPTILNQLTPIITALFGVASQPAPKMKAADEPQLQLSLTTRQQVQTMLATTLRVFATSPLQFILQVANGTNIPEVTRAQLLALLPQMVPLIFSGAGLFADIAPSPNSPDVPDAQAPHAPTTTQKIVDVIQQLLSFPAVAPLLSLLSPKLEPATLEELLPITKSLYADSSPAKSQAMAKPKSQATHAEGLLAIVKPKRDRFQDLLSTAKPVTSRVESLAHIESAVLCASEPDAAIPQGILATAQNQLISTTTTILSTSKQILNAPQQMLTSTTNLISNSTKYLPNTPRELLASTTAYLPVLLQQAKTKLINNQRML